MPQVDLPQVINLCNGSSEEHDAILRHARSAAKLGVPLVLVTRTSNKSTSDVEQRLKVWARQVQRLTSKAAIWQQKASATTARPKPVTWKAVQVWLAGPRDAKRGQLCQGVLTLKPFHYLILHEAWVDANQGTQYMSSPGVVAATDGSVGINMDGLETMGAGV
eukprot:270037-Rhodomonas_salina.1